MSLKRWHDFFRHLNHFFLLFQIENTEGMKWKSVTFDDEHMDFKQEILKVCQKSWC